MKKMMVILLVAAFSFSCAIGPAEGPDSTPVSGSSTSEESPDNAPVSPTEVKNQPPIISRFTTEIGSLCEGKQTPILFSVSDPEDDAVDIQIEAQHGQVLQAGEDYLYQAPSPSNTDGFDTLTLHAADQEHSTSRSISIMLIRQEDTLEWTQTNGPEGGIIKTIEIDPNNPDVLYAGGGRRQPDQDHQRRR